MSSGAGMSFNAEAFAGTGSSQYLEIATYGRWQVRFLRASVAMRTVWVDSSSRSLVMHRFSHTVLVFLCVEICVIDAELSLPLPFNCSSGHLKA